jgi:hypothetical protein
MKHATAATAFSLLALFILAAAPAAAQDDGEDKDRRRIVIEKVGRGDCLSAIRLGEGGPELLSLGSHAFLGVELTGLTPELRRHFGVPGDAGVLIGSVEEDSPAAAAGLRVGDVLTRFDGEDVTSAGRLSRLVREREKDDQVRIEYVRDGKAATATATLGERPRCGFDVGGLVDLESFPLIELEKLPKLLDLDELPAFEGLRFLEFEGDDWRKSMESLRESFESEDWQRQMERLREIDLDGIEERLREAMERLHELEDEIRSTREEVENDDPNV